MAQDTFLLVDDDLDQLSILGAMLSKFPQRIITALNGTRALELLKVETPQLVITDMVMPDISGSEIVRAVRNNPQLSATKIIIITSLIKYISEDDKKLADKILLKPIRKSDLETTVNELIKP